MSSSPDVAKGERNPEARRARLMDCAAAVFAREGFESASLREICNSAQVNLACVSYYFGSKEGLYREVLLEAHRQVFAQDPVPRIEPDEPPQDALRHWIAFCLKFVLLKRPSHPVLGRLMAHEMQRPTASLDDLVTLIVRPSFDRLCAIVAALTGGVRSPADCETMAHHIIGICVHYEHGRAILERMGVTVPRDPREIDRLADEVTSFVLHGICGTQQPPELNP